MIDELRGFYQQYKKSIWMGLVFLAVLTAGLLIYLVFFYEPEQEPTFEGDAKLVIKAPSESASGSEISYEVAIENLSNTKLTGLVLEIFYPRGWTFIDSTPDPPSPEAREGTVPRQFRFADLTPRERHELIIVGKLTGNVQEIKTFNVKLHYVPENFRSTFVAHGQASTMILAPDLVLEVKAPPHIVSGQTISYELLVANVSSRSFSGAVVKINYPAKFSTDQKPEWRIDRVGVGETKKTLLAGKLFEEPGRESLISAELFLEDEGGELSSAGRSFAFTQVRPSPILLTHKALGAGEGFAVGESRSYEIEYENISEVGQTNVQITVTFEKPAMSQIKVQGTGGQIKNNTIVWIPATNPDLLVLAPGQKGKLTFSVQATDQIVRSLQKNPSVKTQVSYLSTALPEPIAGNTVELKVKTEVSVNAQAQAISGATTYRITFEVSNTVNEVSGARMSAIIPRADAEVRLDSIQPSEEAARVRFVPGAGTLTWELDRVQPFATRRLSFNLVVTASGTDFSSQTTLVKNIVVNGRDAFAEVEIQSNRTSELSAQN